MKKSEVKISKKDLADLIRDEIYGATIWPECKKIIFLHSGDVKKIAKKIAMRTIIGH